MYTFVVYLLYFYLNFYFVGILAVFIIDMNCQQEVLNNTNLQITLVKQMDIYAIYIHLVG